MKKVYIKYTSEKYVFIVESVRDGMCLGKRYLISLKSWRQSVISLSALNRFKDYTPTSNESKDVVKAIFKRF